MKLKESIVWQAFPDSDLLPLDSPKANEGFVERQEKDIKHCGCSTFNVVAFEVQGCESIAEYRRRLERCVTDIRAIIGVL